MTAPDPYGWRAHVQDEWATGLDLARVILYRIVGDQREVIRPGTTGTIEAHRSDLGTVMAESAGFLLPRGAIQALVDEVKPGPAHCEVARLEEALAVERGRVDRLLELVARPPALSVEHALREDLGPLVPRSRTVPLGSDGGS